MYIHSDITYIAGKLSPHRSASTCALVGGDDHSTATLHGARREIACYADRIAARSQRLPFSAGRARLIAACQIAYDAIAAELVRRNAL